ncbi:uncharacterized protein LOC142336009 [Convolutriloba macropyga]|uniref:uncharacterized protein LOC142336009 n=1 Tax=Convolutriloba macropyga TaxID=536237 RepID=UPI003F51C8E5
MIREQCAFKSNREYAAACNFLSGISLGSDQQQGPPPHPPAFEGAPAAASHGGTTGGNLGNSTTSTAATTGTVAPLGEPSPEESDEPPDRSGDSGHDGASSQFLGSNKHQHQSAFQRHSSNTSKSTVSHWLLSEQHGGELATVQHGAQIIKDQIRESPFEFVDSNYSQSEEHLNDPTTEQQLTPRKIRPLAIEIGNVRDSANHNVPSNQDHSNSSCATSETTLVADIYRISSQKSSSESTEGEGTVSGTSSSTGGGGGVPSGAMRGIFSPLSLAKTWGQHHSRVLRSAMKRRTVSLDSSNGGGMNSISGILLNGCMMEEPASLGGDNWDRSGRRCVGLTSSEYVRSPFSMFSSIGYSRENNKACLAHATRPRGLKVLPVPSNSERFVVHQLEEVVVLEYEEREPCVSYHLLLNDSAGLSSSNSSSNQSSTLPYSYNFASSASGSTASSRKQTSSKHSSVMRNDEILSNEFTANIVQLGSSSETYIVPVYPKLKAGKISTAGLNMQTQQSVTSSESGSRKNTTAKISASSMLGTDLSFAYYRQISASWVQPTSFISADFIPDQVRFLSTAYAPGVLDDPSLNYATKTCLKLPGYRFSLLHHEEHPTTKQHVNERFKDRFPYVQLTLTKLRSMKLQLGKFLYQDCQFDLCIACYALTYFEKLVFCERVCKTNRRYSAACCAVLAAKMHDIKGAQLSKLISNLCSLYKINKNDLLNFEFPVLVGLKFNLHLPESLLYPVYRSLTQTLT